MSELNTFVERLTHLRGSRSKAEFCRFIGISTPLFNQWENGATPTALNLLLVAVKCGVTVQWLLEGKDVPARDPAAEKYVVVCDGTSEYLDITLSQMTINYFRNCGPFSTGQTGGFKFSAQFYSELTLDQATAWSCALGQIGIATHVEHRPLKK